jgi:hypothetical protein
MRILRRWLALGFVAALYAGLASGAGTPAATPAVAPADLALSLAEPGQKGSLGWSVPGTVREQGYSAQMDTDHPPDGTGSLRLQAPAAIAKVGAFGNLMRSFDAAPFRGQRVRFRAAVRVEAAGTGADAAALAAAGAQVRAQLWLRIDRPGGELGFFDNMSDRPITAAGWRSYEIAGEVAADAVTVNVGIMLFGDGRVWLGAPSFEALGKAVRADEPARPLTARGLDNLVAFARLAGLVRYFHPSDQAAGADWNSFVRAGVESVEKAAGPEDLAHTLTTLFLPLAPTVRIFPSDRPQPVPAEILAAPAGTAKPRILAWRHYGLGLGTDGADHIYSSERIDTQSPVLDPEGAPLSLALPEPGKPLRVDLGGGVSALVPMALYAGAAGTLPAVPAGVQPLAPSRPEGFVPSGNDRATRLADVVLAWNVFEHFYPYFDVVAANWPAELRRALLSAATDPDARAFRDTLRRLVAALHDGHGTVQWIQEGRPAHLPLRWEWVEDRLVVTEVDRERGAGIQRGDVVTAIDGRPVREAIAAEEALISAATPQWLRYRALDDLLLGPTGSRVRLDLQRLDVHQAATTSGGARPAGTAGAAGTTDTVAGTAAKVPVTLTVERSLPAYGPGAIEEHRPDKIAEVAPGIWYFDVGRASDDDWKAALDRLAGARGIVFEARGYPKMSPVFLQHLSDARLHSAQWRVPVIVRPDREATTYLSSSWDLAPATPRLQAKIAFVTDGRAISYAESCLGIVEHYRLGEIVGGPTAGTNGDINPFSLPGGYRITWTGLQVLKHDGSRHHGVGILPTVPMSRTVSGIRAGRDELLEKAIELVSQRPSSPGSPR